MFRRAAGLLAPLFSREQSGTKSAVGLGLAALGGNVLGLLFTVVLARALGPEDYGSLAALVSAFLIVSIAGSALQITVAREVSLEVSRHDPTLSGHVTGWLRATGLITVGSLIVGVILRQPIADLIGVPDAPWGAAFVLATGGAWLMLSVTRGVLQGLQGFQAVALSIPGEAALRVVFAIVLVVAGFGVTGGFLGSGLSIIVTAAVLTVQIRRGVEHADEIELDEPVVENAEPEPGTDFAFMAMVRRTWPALLALTLIATLQNSDVIMVKRDAFDTVAGAYAADAVAAKVIVWIAIGLGFYVVPEAARRGAGEGARRILLRSIGLISVAGAAMVVIYAVAGQQVLELAFGPEFGTESDALPLLGLAMVLLSVSYLTCQYFLALGRRAFLGILAVGVVVQLAALSQVATDPLDTAEVMLGIQAVVAFGLLTASGLLRRGSSRETDDAAGNTIDA